MAIGKSNPYTKKNEIGLLFMEPKNPASRPIYDKLTKLTSLLQDKFVEVGPRSKGVHTCVCGVHSDNASYGFPDKYKPTHITHSLLLHYVTYHRNEITLDDTKELLIVLEKAGFDCGDIK